jgi:L-ascorbate metabolism protein UlaG (beta-lactamase superfamily)
MRVRFNGWPMRSLVALVGVLAVILFVTTGCLASFGARPSGEWKTRVQHSPQYVDGQFRNAEPAELLKSGSWSATREFFFGKEMVEPPCPLPLFDARPILKAPPASGLRITWLGHSSTLIELDGQTILTDPQWSLRASPSTIAGPKRFHPPPLPLADLPHLDAVVISHDHYDHLDMATIQALIPTGVTFHVGLGVGAHLARWGVPRGQIREHAWWESVKLGKGVQVVSTPGRHFSGRGPLMGNSTQWTSWTLIGPAHRVFFSGDTGATALHQEIGDRFGPFDVALIEVGQYHRSWGDIHLGPVGALDAMVKLRARRLLPIHWATFRLGLHAWSEPAETALTEGTRRGLSVLTPRLGEPIEPTVPTPLDPWWRALPPTAPACP